MNAPSSPAEDTISVVIPVRNREASVSFAIDSALCQTLRVHEIIVVNDGSTDGTADILNKISQSNPIVRPIHLPSASGAAAARNVGIKNARSVWIAFLDSDDAWLPEKLERQVNAVSHSTDIVGVFTGIRYVPRVGSILSPYYDYVPDAEINLSSLRQLNHLSSTSTALIRRSLLSEIGGFDEKLPSCQDWDLWLRLAEQGNLHLLRAPLTLCSYENRDRISRNTNAVFEGHRSVFAKIYEADPKPAALRVNKAYHTARIAQIWLLDLNRPARALMQAVSSFLIRPTKLSVEVIKASLMKIIRSGKKIATRQTDSKR